MDGWGQGQPPSALHAEAFDQHTQACVGRGWQGLGEGTPHTASRAQGVDNAAVRGYACKRAIHSLRPRQRHTCTCARTPVPLLIWMLLGLLRCDLCARRRSCRFPQH